MGSVTWILAKCLYLIHHTVSLCFASPSLQALNETEITTSKPKVKVVSEQLVNFFNPVTCHPKENQALIPCQAGENINKTWCLKHKCCHSSKHHLQFRCYAPLKDRAQRILRWFGIGIGGLVVFGCLPFCCCIVEKSPCANPLRRSPKREEESDAYSDSQYADILQREADQHKTKKKRSH